MVGHDQKFLRIIDFLYMYLIMSILDLGIDRYMDLIRHAGTKPNFASNLGKRINKVTQQNQYSSCIGHRTSLYRP